MQEIVKIVECPRDAWQGLPRLIPTEVKVEYLRKLIDAGFRHLDAVSFVSPEAVPQMSDSEQVLELLMPPKSVEIIGIVVNEKGAERALETGAVQTLGFPYSLSPTFLMRNQRQTPEDALDALETIGTIAEGSELTVAAYLSMAFGNPYGEPWDLNDVVAGCQLLVESGAHQISLADTTGLSSAEQVSETLQAVVAACPEAEIGLHLHTRRQDAASRILAAYNAGCRRFDSAVGGLGGCPFAQDVMVGNVSTEQLIAVLTGAGAVVPTLGSMDDVISANFEIARRFGTAVH